MQGVDAELMFTGIRFRASFVLVDCMMKDMVERLGPDLSTCAEDDILGHT